MSSTKHTKGHKQSVFLSIFICVIANLTALTDDVSNLNLVNVIASILFLVLQITSSILPVPFVIPLNFVAWAIVVVACISSKFFMQENTFMAYCLTYCAGATVVFGCIRAWSEKREDNLMLSCPDD